MYLKLVLLSGFQGSLLRTGGGRQTTIFSDDGQEQTEGLHARMTYKATDDAQMRSPSHMSTSTDTRLLVHSD